MARVFLLTTGDVTVYRRGNGEIAVAATVRASQLEAPHARPESQIAAKHTLSYILPTGEASWAIAGDDAEGDRVNDVS
jgi:hypothetical protein